VRCGLRVICEIGMYTQGSCLAKGVRVQLPGRGKPPAPATWFVAIGCRRRWTTRAAMVPTAAPSNRARASCLHAEFPTPRSIAHASDRAQSTATNKTRAGPPGRVRQLQRRAAPVVYQPQSEFTLVGRLLLRAHSWMVS
jgi:hypothetical protein